MSEERATKEQIERAVDIADLCVQQGVTTDWTEAFYKALTDQWRES